MRSITAVVWTALILGFVAPAALHAQGTPILPVDPECAVVFAPEGPRFLHVEPSALSAQELLEAKRYQEAMWVAEETGQDQMAEEIRQFLVKTLTQETPKKAEAIGNGASQGQYLYFKNGVRGVFKSSKVAHIKHEVAAYEMDRLLGLNLVPLTVFRTGKLEGTVQLFIPDATLGPQNLAKVSARRRNLLGLFDKTVINCDRHAGNFMVTNTTNRLVAIDHSHVLWSVYADHGLGFRPTADDEAFYNRLKALTPDHIREIWQPWVEPQFISAALKERKALLNETDALYKRLPSETVVELVAALKPLSGEEEIQKYYSPNAQELRDWFDRFPFGLVNDQGEGQVMIQFVKTITSALSESKIRRRDYRRLLAVPFSRGVRSEIFFNEMLKFYGESKKFKRELDEKGEFFETVYVGKDGKKQRPGMENTRAFYQKLMEILAANAA